MKLFQLVKADEVEWIPKYQLEDDFNARAKRGKPVKARDPTCLNINGRFVCLKRKFQKIRLGIKNLRATMLIGSQ